VDTLETADLKRVRPRISDAEPSVTTRRVAALHWQEEMSKAKLDGEARVFEYFTSRGLRVERFRKAEMRQGRETPDFRVFATRELVLYCEVKTAQEDEWLDRQLAAAPPGTLVGGLRPDPTYNRISSYIHSAVGKFDAVNPAMDHPNVLAIINGDDGAGFTDLKQVLTGNADCRNGEVIPMFHKYSEGRIQEAKLRVHLYLWFNEWEPGGPQMFFPEVHATHHAALCRYLSVDPAAMKRLPA
jgi:hypothetical protein